MAKDSAAQIRLGKSYSTRREQLRKKSVKVILCLFGMALQRAINFHNASLEGT